MTANAFLEDVKKSKEAGMDEHLSKPVDIAALEQTVKRFRVISPPPENKQRTSAFSQMTDTHDLAGPPICGTALFL